MAATSARLALFWGLRVSLSLEELPTIPVPAAPGRASRAEALGWLKSLEPDRSARWSGCLPR